MKHGDLAVNYIGVTFGFRFAWRALRLVVARLELTVSKAGLRRGCLGVEYNGGCLSVSSKPLKPFTKSRL